MGLEIYYVDGQTPLSEEELEGLTIPSITTREELDEFEQFNIEKAIQWTIGKKIKSEDLLSETFKKVCINECMARFGSGQDHLEIQKRI
jgi:hypothetical protein